MFLSFDHSHLVHALHPQSILCIYEVWVCVCLCVYMSLCVCSCTCVLKSPHINDFIQYLTLSAWFISLSIVPSRFIHVVVNLWKKFFFLSCFLYPFICQRTLGLFPCLSCCRWTAINERYRYLFEILTSFSSDEYSEVEMLNIIVELILIFWGTSILFAIEAAPIYISNNSGQGSLSSTFLSNFFIPFLIVAILADVKG